MYPTKLPNWLDTPTTFYQSHYDKVGNTLPFKEILFGKYEDYLHLLLVLQSLDATASNYEAEKRKLKSGLGCFAMNVLEQRTKPVSLSGLMMLDIDNVKGIKSTKAFISTFPSVAWVGVSCSGKGLYCFIRIAEPQRQQDYFLHLKEVFRSYGIILDSSKGKNWNDLRYISYDPKPFLRDDPEPFHPKRFYKPKVVLPATNKFSLRKERSGLINWAVRQIEAAMPGNRFEIIRRVAYCMGGHGLGLDEIKNTINNSQQYTGEESEFLRIADKAFNAGLLKPITV